ncbi:MAG: hypothetical protein V4723_04175 [Pseudomonadota bacterium]
MRKLFYGELRRFWKPSLIVAGSLFVLHLLLNRVIDVPHFNWEFHTMVLVAFAAAGVMFAVYQVGTYRHPEKWLWLLHRPVPRSRIFLAIFSSAAAVIAVAVALPLLFSLALLELMTQNVVDLRHYLMVVFLTLMTLMGWLAGTFCVLSHNRAAIAVLVLPFLILGHLGSAIVMVLTAIPVTILMACIAYSSFKPDRDMPPNDLAGSFALALPLQLLFYFALTTSGVELFHLVQIQRGLHPSVMETPPPGGLIDAAEAKSALLITRALAASSDKGAEQWRSALAESKPVHVKLKAYILPLRHQLSNPVPQQWPDKVRNAVWTFSHDTMQFHGRDVRTGKAQGRIGPSGLGDTQPFPEPPAFIKGARPDGQFVSSRHVYRFDPVTGRMATLVVTPPGERIMSSLEQAGEELFLITTRRLIAYQAASHDGGLIERYSVPHSSKPYDLSRVDVAPLDKGSLISLTYARQRPYDLTQPYQALFYAGHDSAPQAVARRTIVPDFPSLFVHHAWWPSPLLYMLALAPDQLVPQGVPARADHPLTGHRPALVWYATLACALISAAGAAWWLRNSEMSRRRRAGFVMVCLLLGLPALLSLFIVAPRWAHTRFLRE